MHFSRRTYRKAIKRAERREYSAVFLMLKATASVEDEIEYDRAKHLVDLLRLRKARERGLRGS